MGRRGPPPTPTAALKLRGSWRAKNRVNEPTPAGIDAEAPECPEWLREIEYAVDAWNYHVPMLRAIGLLAKLDLNAIARYCATWARYRKCEEIVSAKGSTIIKARYDGDGTQCGEEEKDRPEVDRSIRLQGILDRLERKLGLTPSDRANFATSKTSATAAEITAKELFG